MSILVTKLYIPRPKATHIPRPNLLTQLDVMGECKLMVVTAAAGFGKTSLVAAWAHQHPDQVAWLALDAADNDPLRFFTYVIAALQTRYPEFGQELLVALQSPQPPPQMVPALINELASLDLAKPLALVLDDYHLIETPAIHEALTFLLDYLPPHITLILVTRADPPLPLARYRAKNELREIRAQALRFSEAETTRFLNVGRATPLSSTDIGILAQRTEGWVAGLQLAALALGDNPSDFIREFSGTHRFILDYLLEEVLAQQPPPIRDFLRDTAFLERMNADLCEVITGVGQAMLDTLERQNLFIVPLGAGWYRYHHLFADLLQARLMSESPDHLTELQLQTAHWFADNGYPAEAVGYALAGKEYAFAGELILNPAAPVTQRGEVITLLGWYRAFPAEFVAAQPRLGFYFGMAFALNGRWYEAETLLQQLEDAALPIEETLLFAYLVTTYRQDTTRLQELLAEAQTLPNPTPLVQMVIGLGLSGLGDFAGACTWLHAAQVEGERRGDTELSLTALFHECRLQVFQGNLHQAHTLSQRALQLAPNAHQALFAHVALGRIYIEWRKPAQASTHLHAAIQVAERTGFLTGIVSSATMMLAEVAQAQGDSARANQLAVEALTLAERYDPPNEVEWLKVYQARLWLTQYKLGLAREWLENMTDSNFTFHNSLFYPREIFTVTLERLMITILISNSHYLEDLRKISKAPLSLFTIEWYCLLLQLLSNGSAEWEATWQTVIRLAAAENRIQVFYDLGMTQHFSRYAHKYPQYAKFIANFSNPTPPSSLPDPLNEREVEILRLIVAGQSNEEIAQILILAVSTVKWYINGLYGKLQVKSRTQAIARAHELKLV